MPFSVEILMSDPATAQVRSAWLQLARVSGSDYMIRNGVYPHVALAVMPDLPRPKSLLESLNQLACRTSPARVEHAGIGHFSSTSPVVYLGFQSCGWLGSVHAEVASILKSLGLTNHEYYAAPLWKPHCTLAMEFDGGRLPQVLSAAAAMPWPSAVEFTTLAVIKYPPTDLVWSRLLTGVPLE